MPAPSIMAPMEYEAEKCASRRDQPSPWSVYRRLRLRRREIEVVEVLDQWVEVLDQWVWP
jgi:hypothetical protein